MGIFSPYHKGRRYKIYVGLLMTFSLVGSLASTIDKQTMKELANYSTVIKLIDHIANAFLTTLTVVSSLQAVFIHPSKLSKLLINIDLVDGSLKANIRYKKTFWCAFVLYNLMEVAILSMDMIHWVLSVSIRRYIPYLVRNIQYYQLSIQLFLMGTVALEINHRFRLLNLQLEMAVKKHTKLEICYSLQIKNNFSSNKTITDELKRITKCHNALCDLIDLYSDIFEFSYMLYVVFTTAYIIHYTVVMINYTIFEDLIDGMSLGLNLQIVCCLWIIENCVSI